MASSESLGHLKNRIGHPHRLSPRCSTSLLSALKLPLPKKESSVSIRSHQISWNKKLGGGSGQFPQRGSDSLRSHMHI